LVVVGKARYHDRFVWITCLRLLERRRDGRYEAGRNFDLKTRTTVCRHQAPYHTVVIPGTRLCYRQVKNSTREAPPARSALGTFDSGTSDKRPKPTDSCPPPSPDVGAARFVEQVQHRVVLHWSQSSASHDLSEHDTLLPVTQPRHIQRLPGRPRLGTSR
jgi:hypothetical protein